MTTGQGSGLGGPAEREATVVPFPVRPHVPAAARPEELSPLGRLLLEHKVLAERSDPSWFTHPQGPPSGPADPTPTDVELAAHLAAEWSRFRLDIAEVAAWLRIHPHIAPSVATDLQRHGIGPEEATTRVWYGRLRADRPTLADRVGRGDLTARQAREELRAARAAGRMHAVP